MTTANTALTFPKEELTHIVGKPDYASLQKLKKELYANAMAIPSHRGGGQLGHLALLFTPANYLLLPNAAVFVVPVHPGDQPVHAQGATAPQITETNRAYLAQLAEFQTYNAVEQALKKQMLAAVDETYLLPLQDDVFGFAQTTARAMLAHLTTTYGDLTPDQLETNREKLAADWNPDNPIETLWERVLECQRIATAGDDAISDSTVVRTLLKLLEDTGLFADAVRDWRKRPNDEWTLEHFKEDFTKANVERVRQLTAQTAGYHGANSATAKVPPTIVAGTGTDATTASTVTTGTTPGSVRIGDLYMYYCWSHGLGLNRGHTSCTCKRKKEGHQDDATADNMKGGNNRIMNGPRTKRDGPNE